MKPKKSLVSRAGKALKRASPTILSCLGAFGVVATAILAIRATPKALECIEDAKETKSPENGEKLTRLETIAACWQCYIPATVTGIATIWCIFGANVLNRRQQASQRLRPAQPNVPELSEVCEKRIRRGRTSPCFGGHGY